MQIVAVRMSPYNYTITIDFYHISQLLVPLLWSNLLISSKEILASIAKISFELKLREIRNLLMKESILSFQINLVMGLYLGPPQ